MFVWIGEKSARSDVERGTQTFLFSIQLCNFLIEISIILFLVNSLLSTNFCTKIQKPKGSGGSV